MGADAETLARSGLSDLPSWWAELGRVGFAPDVWLGAAPPWTLAGHSIGGLGLIEPGRGPSGFPWPGVLGANANLAMNDTLYATALDGGAWQGFGAPLVDLTGGRSRPGGRAARGIVDLRSGSFAYDENAVAVERGDSAAWLRAEVSSGTHGTAGPLAIGGRHLWGLGLGGSRGRHGVEATFRHRGMATALVDGAEEHARGESGAARYRYRAPSFELALAGSRGDDVRESVDDLGEEAHRNAQALALSGELAHRSGVSARLAWRDEHVVREGFDAFDREESSTWGAVRYERGAAGGVLRLEWGAGRHPDLPGLASAPGISFHRTLGPVALRVAGERLLNPVWADLGPATEPFLQSTWAGVIDASATGARGGRVRATLLAGRTRDRAVVDRLPLEDLWLRSGIHQDLDPYDFGLLTSDAAIPFGAFGVGVEGFALARGARASGPREDPALGFRAEVAARFRAFAGDLSGRVELGLDGNTGHESEADPPRTLPGFVTGRAAVTLGLADATMTLTVRNLEGRVRDQPWIDASGVEAHGTGRQWRLAFTLRVRD